MFKRYLDFLRGIAVNWVGRTGIILTTSSFITFIFLEFAFLTGWITNVYLGIVNYLILPFLFILGLIFIPIGWLKHKKQTKKNAKDLISERFPHHDLASRFTGSYLFKIIAGLTLLNILFLILSSMGALEFMDDPTFCGTACHSVMNPEWVTYQQSPHARIRCVDCHVGEGFKALINSKINGAWQVISLTFNLYERPIPTPVHQLRPAQKTCEKCHWPDKFYGRRLKTILSFSNDEWSLPKYTTLSLKVDTGVKVGGSGIHWHVSEKNRVHYASVDDKREEMIWVKAMGPDGKILYFENTNLSVTQFKSAITRKLDCVDCHNRATHIYEDPEKAIDERLHRGLLDRSLPFIKREALRAITIRYPSTDTAAQGISNHLWSFYRNYYSYAVMMKKKEIDEAITVCQNIYRRNIHHNMNITWGSYPDHIGHRNQGGCFRCHNHTMIDRESKRAIREDCTLCHSLLSYQSENPFEFLQPVKKKDREKHLHKYLKEEFLKSVKLP